jgi:CBS domain containing-hemolysin-like protein
MGILTLWLIFLFVISLFSYVSFSIISDDVVNSLETPTLEPEREKYSLPPLSAFTKESEQLLALLNFSRLFLTVPLFLIAFKWTAPFGALPVLLTLGCLILLLYLFPQWLVRRGSLKAFRVTVQISAYLLYPIFWGLIRMSPPKIQAPLPTESGKAKANGELQEEQSEEFKGDIIKAISTIGETTVREVMTPRVDMICIPLTTNLSELQDFFKEHKFSRIPVYKEKIDNIVGIVSVMDFVSFAQAAATEETVKEILRPATFVPETKKVFTLLRELRESHAQMAIVIDEYGGTSGLVTLEDLLEEIVGEIEDEYDEGSDDSVEQKDGAYIVTGKFPVENLEELFEIQITAEDFETVSGLVFSVLGRIPMVGEVVKYKNLEIEILEADKRRIHRLRVRAVPQEANAEEVT